MMHSTRRLSLETEFDVRTFSDQVQRMSQEEAQACLVSLCEQMMIRENYYSMLLRQSFQGAAKAAIQDRQA
jgi:hypothetical protein